MTEGTNTWQLAGHNDWYFNNTCVIDASITKLSTYGTFDCDETQDTWPIMGNNSIYAANASSSNLGLCGKSEDSFQKTYKTDLGTKIYGSYPSADELIAQTKAMLFS